MAGPEKGHRRAYAFVAEDAEAQLRRLMRGLAVFCEGPDGIGRALRHARKAARAGASGYDPARHAALVRLQQKAARQARAPASAGTRERAQRPSNNAVER